MSEAAALAIYAGGGRLFLISNRTPAFLPASKCRELCSDEPTTVSFVILRSVIVLPFCIMTGSCNAQMHKKINTFCCPMWTLRLRVTDQFGGLWAETYIIVSLRTTYFTHRDSNEFFSWRNIRLVSQCLHMIEASRSHSGTSHSVGLLWTSDQPDAGTST